MKAKLKGKTNSEFNSGLAFANIHTQQPFEFIFEFIFELKPWRQIFRRANEHTIIDRTLWLYVQTNAG